MRGSGSGASQSQSQSRDQEMWRGTGDRQGQPVDNRDEHVLVDTRTMATTVRNLARVEAREGATLKKKSGQAIASVSGGYRVGRQTGRENKGAATDDEASKRMKEVCCNYNKV